MSVFGGMAKGERNRIKHRVKTAMADQAEREGRFLGGRPPYGYRLVDAELHPNPEKAAAGIHLHRLEPDPVTAPVVRRIFEEFLAGRGWRAIAHGLTQDGVPSPSAYDPARNPHRPGQGWAFSAVRAIVDNPRYIGRQVWGRQPRHERLLDPAAPQDGHVTVQLWADRSKWQYSLDVVHEPIIDEMTFERAQALLRSKGGDRTRAVRSPKVSTPYLFAGRVICGACGRKMSGHRTESRLGYQCRLRADYALTVNDRHPKSVWLPERKLVIAVFDWLNELFSPAQRSSTLAQIADAGGGPSAVHQTAEADLKDIERRIARLVDAVESGAFEAADVADKLRVLRDRRERVHKLLKATPPSAPLDVQAASDLLDRFGGLVGLEAHLTDEERRALLTDCHLNVRFDPWSRTAVFKVALDCGVSARVGGGMPAFSDWRLLPWGFRAEAV